MEASSIQQRHTTRVQKLREQVNRALRDLVGETEEPAALYEPVHYVLAGGGKRFRPILLLLTAEAFGVEAEKALPAAMAVEAFHNFTLVHDDIMDNADTRRGRSTVHVRWDEGTAILAGDLLIGLAYDLLTRVEQDRTAELLQVFHPMVRRLCEGQALDKAYETRAAVTVNDYLQMIDRKTGALLSAALELGGRLGQASADQVQALQQAGQQLGRAYQIRDDLLDLTAENEHWGKAVGGDLVEGKKTFLLLRTLELATGAEHAWFARIEAEGGLSPEEVSEARSRMEALGVLREARQAVRQYSEAAESALARLPDHPARQTIEWLIRRMQKRMH